MQFPSSRLIVTIALAGLALHAASARAQWPDHAVRWVVPFAPGGANDLIARAAAEGVGKRLGQPIVIENKPGAGAIVGTQFVAKAKADGYTFLVGAVGVVTNSMLQKDLPYEDKELIAYAKKQSAPLHYTTGGIGSYGHLWWEMFRQKQSIDGQHVAYNGIAPALKDTMAGEVPLLIDAIVPTGQQISAGSVRGIAIVGAARARSLPNLPTLAEQGYAGFDAAPFYGVLAPAHLDPAALAKLSSTLMQVLAMPELRAKLQDQGFDIVASTPEAYAKLIRDEIELWSKVVKDAGIVVE